MLVSFVKDKETKGTWRYTEVARDENDEIMLDENGDPETAASNLRAVGSLYLSRATRHLFGGTMPNAVTIEIVDGAEGIDPEFVFPAKE